MTQNSKESPFFFDMIAEKKITCFDMKSNRNIQNYTMSWSVEVFLVYGLGGLKIVAFWTLTDHGIIDDC